MFIITRPCTIEWLDKIYQSYKLNPAQHDSRLETLANYISMQKGQPLAFNDVMATIGLHVYVEYLNAQQNPITLDDNCDPNPPGPVGSDPGPSVQP